MSYARAVGPAIAVASVTDSLDGTYSVQFLPPLEGRYVLEVTLLFENDGYSTWEDSRCSTPGLLIRNCMQSCRELQGSGQFLSANVIVPKSAWISAVTISAFRSYAMRLFPSRELFFVSIFLC